MTDQILSISLVPPATIMDKYWVKLEQIVPDVEATLEEATEIIDELFELDPCTETAPEDQPVDERTLTEKIADAKEKYVEALERRLQDSLCTEACGSYQTTVKLYRSHQVRPYTLLKKGCTVISTITGNIEQVSKTVSVKNGTTIDINLPGDQPITAAWAGDVYAGNNRLDSKPEITIEKGTVYWRGQATGAIALSYPLPYELLTIEVAGVEGDPVDAALTALYHLSVDDINIEPPPSDELSEEVCSRIDDEIEIPPEEGDCFMETNHLQLCDCSKRTNRTWVSRSETACPEGVDPGTVVKRKNETTYVDCNETDDVNKREFYIEKCCEPPPDNMPLPECEKKYRIFNGKSFSQEKREQLQRTYGMDVNIVMVGPRTPPCGDMVYEQKVQPRNCCDGVSQLVWDTVNSAELVSPSSHADVFVESDTGIKPLSWRVRGEGFYTNSALTQRDAVTGSSGLRIYTNEDACGTCQIYVTDGCSSVNGVLRSTEGWWEPVPESQWPVPGAIDHYDTTLPLPGTIYRARVTEGQYRYTQLFDAIWNKSAFGTHYSSYDEACANKNKTLAEIIAEALADFDSSVPMYISNDIFEQGYLAQEMWPHTNYPTTPGYWNKCASGVLCLVDYKYYNSTYPHYRCYDAAALLNPTDDIQIERWVCP